MVYVDREIEQIGQAIHTSVSVEGRIKLAAELGAN